MHEQLARVVSKYGTFVERVSRGDLSATVEAEGEGELAQLGSNLDTMGRTLRNITLRIDEVVGALSSATAEILSITQEHSAAAAESAAAVSETVASVDAVSQTAQHAAQRADAVATASKHSVAVSSTGHEAVDRTIGAMNRVREQVASIGERILALSDRAQTVGQIIMTVNELAEQSNLLALNAAIEAARAGEHGRSFAVVAQEVRNLAEQSKRATSQVRAILGDIQKSTHAAVLVTEEGNKTVVAAVDAARIAGDRIEQLAATIHTAAGSAQEIVAAARQQVDGVTQSRSRCTPSTRPPRSRSRARGRSIVPRAISNDLSARLRDAVAQYQT